MDVAYTQFSLLTVFSGMMSGLKHPGKHVQLDPGGIVWISPKESLRISVENDTIRERNIEVNHRGKVFVGGD